MILSSRTYTLDLTVVQRAFIDAFADELSHAVVRVEKPTADPIFKASPCLIGKRRGFGIATLFNEDTSLDLATEIDAATIKTWRCSCLQPTNLKPQRFD
jgi:hypothetical protein